MNTILLKQLQRVEKIASLSKLGRLCYNPYKYIVAIVFRELIYPIFKKEKLITTHLFFGNKIKIALPASTDIFLTGGKSDNSEIRLAKFLIHNLKQGDIFLDTGAHYGYFSLLASMLVENTGKVYSIEPSYKTYCLLAENIQHTSNVKAIAVALSNTNAEISFFEFHNLYSEYNTTDIAQYENKAWYANSNPSKRLVPSKTLDTLTTQYDFVPTIIKLDVEGAELSVVQGAKNLLQNESPILVMEYVAPQRLNLNHKKAIELLVEWGYTPMIILNNGELELVHSLDQHLTNLQLESDNIVLKKQ